MDFRIPEPCEERWDAMERRPEGRFCQRCQHTVVDLSRLTRREAERAVRAEADSYLCVRLAVDADAQPIFRPEPRRAAQWAGGLVLAAALSAGGCSESGSRDAPAPVAIEPAECELPGAPMTPIAAEQPEAPVAEQEPQPVEVEATGPVVPTAEQRALTRRKQRLQQNGSIGSGGPVIRHVAGRMPVHRYRSSTRSPLGDVSGG